jgi:ABC-type Na+ efflux pump permease subunit
MLPRELPKEAIAARKAIAGAYVAAAFILGVLSAITYSFVAGCFLWALGFFFVLGRVTSRNDRNAAFGLIVILIVIGFGLWHWFGWPAHVL